MAEKTAAGKKVHAAVSQPLPSLQKRQQPKGNWDALADAVTVKRHEREINNGYHLSLLSVRVGDAYMHPLPCLPKEDENNGRISCRSMQNM
jgi:hypothetical protein